MKIKLPAAINGVQASFAELCKLGGGPKGGPARTKVQKLLFDGGKKLNDYAYAEVAEHLETFSDRNPWHVCFVIGLSWGHLAKLEIDFTDAATRALESWDSGDIKAACAHHLERGPQPIEQSLQGGRTLFQSVKLPAKLPNSLAGLRSAQNNWFRPIASAIERPKYIGNWNATAMFMVALFAQPDLAKTLLATEVLLPPGGPISAALALLHKAHVIGHPPSENQNDGGADLALIAADNGLIAEIRRGLDGWSLIDVHSGLYLLGTRSPLSKRWSL
jgi:hypothetical protein